MAKIWLALVALLLLAAPTAAFAESAQPFTASGNICLTQLPQRIRVAPQPTGIRLIALGEKEAGVIVYSSGWDALNGAAVNITITREESVFDFTTLTFSGKINGTLVVTTTSKVLNGKLEGTVNGAFLDPSDILGSITGSSVQVNWLIKGKDAKASGQATASFALTGDGFCGPLSLDGTVR